MRRLAGLAVLLGFVSLGGFAGLASDARGAAHELVPAYFGPEGSPSQWQVMCEASPPGSTVILNPDNGPVKRQAASYAPVIRYCEERGQKVIGYVYTRYGRRSLSAVKKAISDYYLWYVGVEGVFLDEMAEVQTAKRETYYENLAALVHAKGGLAVGNPGDTASTAWQLNAVDQVVTFEGSAASYETYVPATWVLHARPEQIANIVFSASGVSQMEAVCERSTVDNAGALYVTDLRERPNPYEALPSYWTAETERCFTPSP